MKCPRCQSSKVDASGICLTCGYEVSQWQKKLEQRLHDIRQKEEEIEQSLQSIIDSTVSHQPAHPPLPKSAAAPPAPHMEDLAFIGQDNGDDKPVVDLFVNVDDGTQDVSGSMSSTPQLEALAFVETDDDGDTPVLDLFVNVDGGTADASDGMSSTLHMEDLAFIETGNGEDTPAVDLFVNVDDAATGVPDGMSSTLQMENIAFIEPDNGDDKPVVDTFVNANDGKTGVPDNASSTPQMENIAFIKPDNGDDKPVVDTFVNANDGKTGVPDRTIAAHAADTGYIAKATDVSGVETVAPGDKDVAYKKSIVADGTPYTSDKTIVVNTAGARRHIAKAAAVSNVEAVTDAYDNSYAEDSLYIPDASNPEGRLIFLSRTLSGLVDLFLIVLFTGIFLCAADYFTNAPMLNSINVISFPALFLMIYFLYSVFLLGTNGQTIGMIMTDLRVVSVNKNPLLFSQVFRRSAAFLVSLFVLGIGLLIGVLSRDCMCMHDRTSETRVIRS